MVAVVEPGHQRGQLDVGDFVVVVNAGSIRVTGNKAQQRRYYRHSTYPGGLKSVALGDLLAKHPERVIKHTVRGMLPHNALGRKMLRKLKVYAGPQHPHSAQFRAYEKQQHGGGTSRPIRGVRPFSSAGAQVLTQRSWRDL